MPAEKGLDIEVIGGGRHEELRVAGPTHAFIPLRAIGRDFQIVAFLAPDNVVLELVDQGAALLDQADLVAAQQLQLLGQRVKWL